MEGRENKFEDFKEKGIDLLCVKQYFRCANMFSFTHTNAQIQIHFEKWNYCIHIYTYL